MTLDDRLASLAAAGETITYGTLARETGLRMGELTAALEAGMVADHAAGRPFRAAVCEGRLARGMPAKGFFDMVTWLGMDVVDPVTFVAEQRRALTAGGG
jgi:hypothetical protein